MSFSSKTKAELCRASLTRACCVQAELYGVLLYCHTFTHRELRVVTEQAAFAQRLEKLLHRAADLRPERRSGEDTGGKIILSLRGQAELERLCAIYGLEPERSPSHHINLGVLEEECCRVSFLRGAFLAGGSITDPNKGYHMEFITSHFSVSREAAALLRELGFRAGEISRGGNYVTYFKQSEVIEDLLTTLGAPLAAMELMNAKAQKELANGVNRRTNCEYANLGKTVDAAQDQLRAIRALERQGKLGTLSPKLREAAVLRLENPEMSLSQLADITSPPVSKSSLHHRLKKLMEMAEEHE